MNKEEYKNKLSEWIEKTNFICEAINETTPETPTFSPIEVSDTLSGTMLCSVYMRETLDQEWKLNTAVQYIWPTKELGVFYQVDQKSERGNQIYARINLTENASLEESLSVAAGCLENIELTVPKDYYRVLWPGQKISKYDPEMK